ncbi:MAG: hypothetical protein IPJ20_22050 [Flammeovirgaceae bacterium]|nr:hypothetical protein [Flammeovirgaceae bacterium]
MKFFEDQSLSLNGHSHDVVEPGGHIFSWYGSVNGYFSTPIPASTFAFHVQGKEITKYSGCS